MERLVGGQSDRIAQLPDNLVIVAERDRSDSRQSGRLDGLITFLERSCHLIVVETGGTVLPCALLLRRHLHLSQLHIVPEDDLGCLGKHREVYLFSIAVHAHVNTTGIHPSASVLSGSDIVEVTHHIITEIVLQMLSTSGIARFGTCPESVKINGFFLQVETETVEMIVPVGVFDDDFHLGIHLLCRSYHQFLAGISHQAQAVVCPTLTAFGGNLIIVLDVDEEEIVENEIVKMLRRVFSDFPDFLTVGRTRITVSLEIRGF